MKELRTEIEINASPNQVWEVLADFGSYPTWNSFITEVRGVPKEGEWLVIRAALNPRRTEVFRPVVLRCQPGRELRWRGTLPVPGMFAGEHSFLLEPLPGGKCRLIHREEFTGLLVRLVLWMIGADTLRGFHAMNRALQQRSEDLHKSIQGRAKNNAEATLPLPPQE
ncbi:MAG: SRPBCC domain-containing protein [Chlorobi bacterium CHB2]|nr:SRPBCC domain-containing protein [Chlorobi bacterium CHB2]